MFGCTGHFTGCLGRVNKICLYTFNTIPYGWNVMQGNFSTEDTYPNPHIVGKLIQSWSP